MERGLQLLCCPESSLLLPSLRIWKPPARSGCVWAPWSWRETMEQLERLYLPCSAWCSSG